MKDTHILQEGPVTPGQIAELTGKHGSRTTAGAHALFLGQVRADETDGKTVSGIEYSAYEAMVGPVAASIRETLFSEFPDLICLHIVHSTGLVKAGEVSLLVMVTTAHRKQAFRVLESCVELIKEQLPVWKKELFTDGTSRWIG